jgi:phage I-like protein
MNRENTNRYSEMSALPEAPLAGDAPPTRVLLAPWGRVESANGDFVVDAESVAEAVAAFERQATDLPIDYEHQTLGGVYSSPTGQAPAAGWIKRLVGEVGVGLFAEIEWTPQGRSIVAAKAYRYLSPVAVVRRADRKLVGIHSAALTNKPAIRGMTPIVNGIHDSGAADESPLELLRGALGLSADRAAEEVLIAAGARLATLQEETRRRRIDDRIGEALRAGKLAEAQRGWAERVLRRDEALFAEWLAAAPVLVPMGVTRPPTSRGDVRRESVAAAARAEFRASRLLATLTTEEAYVADALRAADDKTAATSGAFVD